MRLFPRLCDKAICIVIAVMLLAASFALYSDYSEERQEQLTTSFEISADLRYAYQFRLLCVSTPELEAEVYGVDFAAYPNTYKYVSFVMEPPPEEGRIYGVIYASPREGTTENYLKNLNLIISDRPEVLEGTGLNHPLAIGDILWKRTEIKEVIGNLTPIERESIRFGYPDNILLREN